MTEKDSNELPKKREVQASSDLVRNGGVIGDGNKQADWRTAQRAHMLEQDESATDLFYKPGTKQATQKFELIDDQPAAGASKVLHGKVEHNELAPPNEASDNTPEGWLAAGKRIAALPLDKQALVIATGLAAASEQYERYERDRQWGAIIGTVQGIGNFAVNLGKISDFSAYCIIGDNKRAAQMGEEFGNALGQTLVSGVKLFDATQQYSYDIGYSGDYAKPIRDLLAVGKFLNDEWSNLSPREQERRKYEIVSQMFADGLIGLAGAKAIGEAKTLTEMLDIVAGQAGMSSSHNILAFEKTSQKVAGMVDDLMQAKLDEEIIASRRAGGKVTSTVLEEAKADDISLSREHTPAVGKGGDWPVLNERPSVDVVQQETLISCAAAVGEMLSGGTLKQNELFELVGTIPETLAEHLGAGWKGGFVPNFKREIAFDAIMRTGKPWAAELRDEFYHRVEMGHMVMVDGYDEAGNIMIRDPMHATRYEMTRMDFFHHWSDRALFDTL